MPKGKFLSVIFSLRLAPDEVRIITPNDDQTLFDYAQRIVSELRVKLLADIKERRG